MIPSQFTATQEELSLADIILSKALDGQIKREDPAAAKLDADTAVKVFLTTKLSPQVLSEIWSEADIGEKGWLTRQELTVALRFIGWAQSGRRSFDRDLLSKVLRRSSLNLHRLHQHLLRLQQHQEILLS
ncbi:hypothetical protein F5051DRAFT_155030 [Lentinula edodes]|nr:hypothetical protein F5051DRAFT_155030 [Lentinula edodes]